MEYNMSAASRRAINDSVWAFVHPNTLGGQRCAPGQSMTHLGARTRIRIRIRSQAKIVDAGQTRCYGGRAATECGGRVL